MANRCQVVNQIENLSGNVSATIFDGNWQNPVTALNDSSLGYINYGGVDTGSANNYLVTCAFGNPSALNAGMYVGFYPSHSNTGASTLTVTGTPSSQIKRGGGAALIGGEIVANVLTTVFYDGAQYILHAGGPIPLLAGFLPITANQTVACSNASTVFVYCSFTTSTARTITLQNLAIGTPVMVWITGNTSGATANLFLSATNPAGTAYSISLIQNGIAGYQTAMQCGANKAVIGNFMCNGASFVGSIISSL